jgi:hypothetical protein
MSNFDFTGKPGLQAFIEGQIARAVEAERRKFVRCSPPMRHHDEHVLCAGIILGAIAGASLILALQFANAIL